MADKALLLEIQFIVAKTTRFSTYKSQIVFTKTFSRQSTFLSSKTDDYFGNTKELLATAHVERKKCFEFQSLDVSPSNHTETVNLPLTALYHQMDHTFYSTI